MASVSYPFAHYLHHYITAQSLIKSKKLKRQVVKTNERKGLGIWDIILLEKNVKTPCLHYTVHENY